MLEDHSDSRGPRWLCTGGKVAEGWQTACGVLEDMTGTAGSETPLPV